MEDEQQAEIQTEWRPNEFLLYPKLADEFDQTFQDTRGGFTFDYVTGEQVASRLNDVLGFLGWSFKIIEHGIHAEADECWALGELTVHIDERTVTRQQFGSQKIKRSRSSGTPLDIGFDLKGAGTDAMKKCASLVGVALYLSKKEAPAHQGNAPAQSHQGNANQPAGPRPLRPSNGGGTAAALGVDEPMYCEECGDPLTETRFKDGTVWSASQLAVFGRRKHSRILDMKCYRQANNAKRAAEEALQSAPF